MKYEYIFKTIKYDLTFRVSVIKELNELGKEGWELVSVVSAVKDNGYTNELLYHFKRPLAD